ncbi:Tyrosine-protein kinase receptor UFO [Bagarius yarrelli]|uniref:Tyrosine-protein kinase receptor UFO n=1 Tax=Bagarius yarrelli TaxID=175774 RepID=A0A556UY73_BAGYA|nr:Tyrosine-protein kinase receptor UFO [Bagarius yarrelli]
MNLLFVGFVAVLHFQSCKTVSGLHFKNSPGNITSSLGKPVEMQCVLMMKDGDEGEEGSPDIQWLREGQLLEFSDTNQVQMLSDDETWLVISTLRIAKVQLSDMGAYRCAVDTGDNKTKSAEGHLQLEGLPHFSVEPHPMSIIANVSLSLQCVAHGPPEPVRIIWLQDGAPLNTLDDPIALSPSRLNLTGLNKTSSFSCEAHNRKGVASSSSGVISVLPSQPQDVRAVETTNSTIRLSWSPGFGGIYAINLCTLQVKPSEEESIFNLDHMTHNQNVNIPPASHLISDLQPFTQYNVRVACRSSQGVSDWTPWVIVSTNEGVPDSAPVNLTAALNGTELLIGWAEPEGKINGKLQGYIIEYNTPNTEQGESLHGSRTRTMDPVSDHVSGFYRYESRSYSSPPALFWRWWYVVIAVAVAIGMAVLMAIFMAKWRRKETRFG